jgi:hypothetical protein
MGLSWIPRWIIVLIIIAVLVFIANALGIIHIHGSIQGSVGL